MIKSTCAQFLHFLFFLQQRFFPGFRPDRIPMLGKSLRWILGFFQQRKTLVDGHLLEVGPKDTFLFSVRKVYEPTETRFFKNNVRSQDIVIDIGANIGYYTLLFARATGASGQVIAFEPAPQNFELLKKNIKENGYQNTTLVHAAVGDCSKKIQLHFSENNMGDHRIYADENESRKSTWVDCISIDEYLSSYDWASRIAYIKMDIQGAEMLALRGMKKTLENNRDLTLVMEFWPKGLSMAGFKAEEIFKFLKDLSFQLYHLDENSKSIQNANFETMITKYSLVNGEGSSLIASRRNDLIFN